MKCIIKECLSNNKDAFGNIVKINKEFRKK